MGKNNTGFNGFSQTNFISQDRTTRERRPERKQGSINLMGIQINLGISEKLPVSQCCRMNSVWSARVRNIWRGNR